MNIRKLQVLLTTTALILSAGMPIQAQEVDISQHPLFLSSFVEPNVLFVLDDSGSMHWETMPDAMTEHFGSTTNSQLAMNLTFPITLGVHGPVEGENCGNGDCDYASRKVPRFCNEGSTDCDDEAAGIAAAFRSSHMNSVYYNPAVTYQPWVDWDSAESMADEMDPADANAALHSPINTGLGARDLTVSNSERANWVDGEPEWDWICCNQNGWYWGVTDPNHTDEEISFWPATYYFPTENAGNAGDTDDPANWNASNYERVEIRDPNQGGQAQYTGHGRENRTDCDNGECSYGQEIQNFANWYTYHRNRVFAARAGIGRAFVEQSDRMRVGYGTINTSDTVTTDVRSFGNVAREAFFDELYGRNGGFGRQGTPLRNALSGAGEYYGAETPWRANPEDTNENPEEFLECRQSYTVLMTDGFWNGSAPDGISGSDESGSSYTHPDDPDQSFQYQPSDPFQGGHATNGEPSLADVAIHYWKDDLRPTMDNRVPTNTINPAFWQHMVTFGVGLGVEGDIPPDDAFAAIETGTFEHTWPTPSANAGSANIDDLLHAGVNSRGGFFNAMNAGQFSRELSRVLREIIARAGLVTGFAPSATRLVTDSLIFEANFNGEDWSGSLVAWDPEDDFTTPEWTATDDLPHDNFFTWDGNDGVNFDTGADINVDDDVILYIRGDQSQENPDGPFRARQSLLGDIINSQPTFSGPGNEGWARLGGDAGAAYIEYITDVKRPPDDGGQRRNAVFVGANDGMLHAFDAETGSSLFAYVPRAVHDKLHLLTDPAYSHEFYVDGEITIRDACNSTTCSSVSNWKTVLVGGLGAGGKGIFALDVTNPASPSVLWEINEDSDGFVDEAGVPTLGHTFGAPAITRLHDGRFVAVFGNGYGSDSNQAWLYVVDLFSGEKISDIGLAADDAAPQGLSGPRVWLHGGNRIDANRIYAGDLQGNLWRVDVGNNGALTSRFGDDPLFAAGVDNPITVNPTLAVHPSGGLMVYFGTGKFFEEGDNEISVDEPVQKFYAIRDTNPESAPITSGIESISMTEEDGLRVVDNEAAGENGWSLELVVGNDNVGERVLHTPRVLAGRVIFTTYEPELDVCGFGGERRIYVLNAINGDGRIGVAQDDGTPCSNCGGVVIEPGGGPIPPEVVIVPPGSSIGDGGSGWDSELGFLKPPTEDDDDFFGSLGTIREGRQVWRQIQ